VPKDSWGTFLALLAPRSWDFFQTLWLPGRQARQKVIFCEPVRRRSRLGRLGDVHRFTTGVNPTLSRVIYLHSMSGPWPRTGQRAHRPS
jgi:hypothetical protein